MSNSWQNAEWVTTGTMLGPFIYIPVENRSTSLMLSGGAAATFTDAWTRASIATYVPVGVRGLRLRYYIQHSTASLHRVMLRKKGATITSSVANTSVVHMNTAAAAGGHGSYVVCECNTSGIIEYAWDATTTGAQFDLNIEGYFL
jgi:hypothetical protein